MRLFLGVMAIVLVGTALWLAPWRTVMAADDDGLPWIAADGARYTGATFPELYKVVTSTARSPDGSFRVPDFSEEHDYLANAQFGSRPMYRCISTRRLEDHTPAGTLGWCAPHGS